MSLQVIISDALPLHPSDGQNARRMVRHGLSDILEWLGEEVGPEPGVPAHAIITSRSMFVSRERYQQLRNQAAESPIYPFRGEFA